MSNQPQTIVAKSGPPFLTLLAILFIALKLTGHIAWSWLGVLSPLWIPLGLVLAITLVVLLVAGVAWGVGAVIETRKLKGKARRMAASGQFNVPK